MPAVRNSAAMMIDIIYFTPIMTIKNILATKSTPRHLALSPHLVDPSRNRITQGAFLLLALLALVSNARAVRRNSLECI